MTSLCLGYIFQRGIFWIFELKSFTIFAKNWILDVWLISEYIFDCFYCVLQYVPLLENYLNILLVVTLLMYVKCVFLFIRIKLINLFKNLYFLAAWLFNNIEIMSYQRWNNIETTRKFEKNVKSTLLELQTLALYVDTDTDFVQHC